MNTNRVALVTGGTSGIGASIAQRLVKDGLDVAVVGRSADSPAADGLDAVDGVFQIRADITRPGAPDDVVGRVIERFGRLDVLVNNAGRRHAGLIVDTPPEEIADVFAVNTLAAMSMTAAAARVMIPREDGAVINMLSRLASVGVATLTAYTASKGALLAYTRGAAVELAPHNIRVNAVAPGMTRTPLIDSWLADQPDPTAALDGVVSAIPLGRLGTVADTASAVSYLASTEASYLTGVSIPVDGGYTAQ
ncbi:glucose 1-dehydrogenase [Tsukamurella sp. 8F]|uniref:SDR family NAD(P)-dependent oxidoreductase n=1 Tax=unclassified Tsukamurella TaxID=2633480 RepID=UPI0023B9F098|nr:MULTISPECIES: glucose 1-dehydrogenase [unclassified Tsukamurella]MDF0532341.1 glucose 1-dehydrogenase [Tsukamurella sp. 8J]MDF0589459.1 glucose 1-dehydrogenase [Tsukamurella sp. 8F]